MNTHEETLQPRQPSTLMGFLLHGRVLYHTVRLALAVSFIVAASYKFADLDSFAGTIADFGILPAVLVDWTALTLPTVEFLAALVLAFDVVGGLSVITSLIALFITVLAYGIALGLDIDCGCYGPGDPAAETFSSLHTSLYRDFGLLALAGYCWFWRMRNQRRPLGIRDVVKRLRAVQQ